MYRRRKPQQAVLREKAERKRRYGESWDVIRKKIYERDGYRCRACGAKGKLHAHHILLLRVSKSNDYRNLISLCPSCHKKIEQNALKMLKEGKHRFEIVRWTHLYLKSRKNESLLSETQDKLCDTDKPTISIHNKQDT